MIASWNIRGLNDPKKQKEIVNFCRDCRISLLCISETKVKPPNVQRIWTHILPTWRLEAHQSGRLWVGWNPVIWDVEIIVSSDQVIHCHCKLLGKDFSCFASFVYGANDIAGRRTLWSDLLTFKSSISEPWIILGDFNEYRYLDDKVGGNVSIFRGMEEFNDFCFEAELEDIRMSGIYLSWTNRCPSNQILRRLDRAIVNYSWLQKYPASLIQVVSPGLSDHCPLVLHLNLDVATQKTFFKFFHCWVTHSDFLPIVQEVWKRNIEGTPMFQVVSKLKLL